MCPDFGTKRFNENHRFKECAPGVQKFSLLFFDLQVVHILTQTKSLRSELHSHFSCRYAPHYLPRLESFDCVSQMGPYLFVRMFLIPHLTSWFFNNKEKWNLISLIIFRISNISGGSDSESVGGIVINVL